MTHTSDNAQLQLHVVREGRAAPVPPRPVCVAPATGPQRSHRQEQLTIVRCPFCSAFLGYRGVGRPRIVCSASPCRRARHRELAASRAAAARTRRLTLLLLVAALARR